MITKAERKWVLRFALVVMFLTSLPYVLGYLTQGETWRFSGFIFGVEDGNSYLGKMLRGSAGEWLFRSPYSAVPQRGALIFVPYILLGKLVAPPGTHDQLVNLYHLFRFGSGVLAILATYDFLAIFCKAIWARRTGVVLAILGGGLGWLLLFLGQRTWFGTLALEFYSPESFGFLGIFGIPHLALARALLLWSLTRYLWMVQASNCRQPAEWLKAGLLWLLASLAQPLAGLVVGFVIGIHLAALAGWQVWRKHTGVSTDWPRWREIFRSALVAGIIPLPYLLYNLIVFAQDPYLKIWTLQNQIPSPHPAHYLLAYIIVLPLVFSGALKVLRHNPWSGWLLVSWTCSLTFLAYAPFALQRRLPEGIWVAMVALVIVSIEYQPWSLRARKGLVIGLLITCTLSTLILWSGSIQAILRPGEPIFLKAAQSQVFEYLESSARKDQVVLTSFQTGNALPAWTPQFVVIGHGPESADLEENLTHVNAFFGKNISDRERLALLKEFDVDYLIWGSSEQDQRAWDPRQMPFLRAIFEQEQFVLFQVISAEN